MRRLLSALTLLASGSALAGGFAVSEHDAAASGRMGTTISQVETASSVHYNPAGLAGLNGVAATAGVTAISASVAAGDPSTGLVDDTQGAVKTPPHAYVGYGQDRWALGLGVNAPFGGGVRYDESWRGRFDLIELKLQAFGGHLGGAYLINDRLSVGANVSVFSVSVGLEKHADFVDAEGTALLGGSGTAVGGGLGVSFKAHERVRLGLVGKLPTRVPLKGRAHFENIPDSYQNTLPDQAISTSMTLPGKLGLGVQGDLPFARLYLDGEYTFWSSFQSFDVDFEQPQTPDVSQPRSWGNALTVRLGAERDLANTIVRAGVMFDQAASPADTLSPSLPDSNRVGFSVGAGRDVGPLHADLAYQFIAFLPRSSEGEAFRADYNARAHLVALSLSFRTPKLDESPLAPVPLTENPAAVTMATR